LKNSILHQQLLIHFRETLKIVNLTLT
jgi:hypothetical protein